MYICVYICSFFSIYKIFGHITVYPFHSKGENGGLWEVTFWEFQDAYWLLQGMGKLFLPISPLFLHVLYLGFANRHSEHEFEWNRNCMYQIIFSGVSLQLFPSFT